MLDEVDAQLGSSKEMAEALRGILNSGFKRRGNFIKCVGEGSNMTTRKFKTFCPKALAGIGRLPDTVADRSIPIKLKRRASGEQVKPLFEEDWEADARPIANGFGDELEPKTGDLLGTHPRPVGGLSDRAEEAWRPLLVVADLAGGEWPGRARRAARALCGEGDVADEEIGIRLLAALRDAFRELDTDWLPTEDVLSYLHSLDGEPWGDWSRGNPITKRRVADLLRPFDIRPKQVRVGEDRQRGYRLEDCEGEFSRYLPPAAHGGAPNRDNGSSKPERHLRNP